MKKIFTLIFFAFFLSLDINAQIINTIVGTGTPGSSGDGGNANLAQLSWPIGVAFDATNNLYITDNGVHRIRKVNTSGIISTFAGTGVNGFSGDGGPATSAQLSSPGGVAIDAFGNVYISELGNNRIRKVNTSGIISTFAGTGVTGFSGDGGPAINAQLNSPTRIAIDGFGNVYIADNGNNRIRKINTSGIISTFAGTGVAGFSGDGGLAINAQLKYPFGVSFDSGGNLYVTDSGNNRIRKVNTSGIISTFAGTGIAGFSGDGGIAISAQLTLPYEISFDSFGNSYIADEGNSRIRKINLTGTISTIAGTVVTGFSGDGGLATSAQIWGPFGVTIDVLGNVYIADNSNSRIRKVTFATDVKQLEKENTNYSIYPNPTNSFLSIQSKTTEEKSITLCNTLGEEILKNNFKENLNVDLKDISSGIYFLNIRSEKTFFTNKIVVAH